MGTPIDPAMVGRIISKRFPNPETGRYQYYRAVVEAASATEYKVIYEDGDSELMNAEDLLADGRRLLREGASLTADPADPTDPTDPTDGDGGDDAIPKKPTEETIAASTGVFFSRPKTPTEAILAAEMARAKSLIAASARLQTLWDSVWTGVFTQNRPFLRPLDIHGLRSCRWFLAFCNEPESKRTDAALSRLLTEYGEDRNSMFFKTPAFAKNHRYVRDVQVRGVWVLGIWCLQQAGDVIHRGTAAAPPGAWHGRV